MGKTCDQGTCASPGVQSGVSREFGVWSGACCCSMYPGELAAQRHSAARAVNRYPSCVVAPIFPLASVSKTKVFVTKYRRNVFRKEHLEAMQQILANVCRGFEAGLVEFNGEHDHAHLLVNYPPKVALSTLVASLKSVSSRMLRQQYGDFHPWLKRRGVLWSPLYFAASCGGAPLDILRQYIAQQQAPHQTPNSLLTPD